MVNVYQVLTGESDYFELVGQVVRLFVPNVPRISPEHGDVSC